MSVIDQSLSHRKKGVEKEFGKRVAADIRGGKKSL